MKDFNESLATHFDLMRIIHTHNLCVTEIDINERRKSFFDFLAKKNLVSYLDDNLQYDYVVIDALKSPVSIYEAYQKHNGKTIIFDTPKLFSRVQYVNIAEGGFCSSPDSGSKWKVSYDGKKEFMFTGHVTILTTLKYDEIKKGGEKFKYIIRDMNFIR